MNTEINVKVGYAEILKAQAALEMLKEAVHVAKNGCGLGIPGVAFDYIAELGQILRNEERMLQEELGIRV